MMNMKINRKHKSDASVAFVVVLMIVIAVIAFSVWFVFTSFVTTKPVPSLATRHIISKQQTTSGPASNKSTKMNFSPPSPNDAPPDIRPSVLHGEAILLHTHKTLPSNTGNELNCTHCHFEAGTTEKALSLVGVWSVYPKYDRRFKRPIDLTMKTNACFIRYLNAKPLKPDSNDMIDILVYYKWISKGIPVDANVPWLGLRPIEIQQKPDIEKGKQIFGKCIPCHGEHGQGMLPSDGPPLWGKGTFPAGGGMGKADMFAAFVHELMPKDNPDLSVRDAVDVAAFVLSHPRPQKKQEYKE